MAITVVLPAPVASLRASRVVDAVRFAVEIRLAMAERNAQVPEDRRIVYRVRLIRGFHKASNLCRDQVFPKVIFL